MGDGEALQGAGDSRGADRGETSHDRLVGTCYLSDGTDIGAELIKQGLALDYTPFSGGKYKHLEVPGMRRKLAFIRRKWEQDGGG